MTLRVVGVSVPYEITLLSNYINSFLKYFIVSVPYEITLLSNILCGSILLIQVSVPYEITLLSNSIWGGVVVPPFQYLMKLHYSQTSSSTSLS